MFHAWKEKQDVSCTESRLPQGLRAGVEEGVEEGVEKQSSPVSHHHLPTVGARCQAEKESESESTESEGEGEGEGFEFRV
jgi:hypothetical protein